MRYEVLIVCGMWAMIAGFVFGGFCVDLLNIRSCLTDHSVRVYVYEGEL